jgi:ABC-2 type transport system ATP-binding protein
MIRIDNLKFAYNTKEVLFDDFNLLVNEGSVFGLLGPNGSGKTTLIRLILNLLKAQNGTIEIMGETNHRNNVKLRKNIGAIIESPSLYSHLTGRENLELFSKVYDVSNERIKECIDIVDLGYAADKKIKRYSLGMKQRLSIASCLLHNPSLLMFDEPMNGLDPQGIHDMRELILRLNKEGKTIFISSHILSEIESTCSDIGIIKNGKTLFSGKTNDLMDQMHSNRTLVVACNDQKKAVDVLSDYSKIRILDNHIEIDLQSEVENHDVIEQLINNKIRINEAYNKTNNLESLFLELTK